MVQQNNMRPEIPAGIAQSPQFAAARSITQEGLPAMFQQVLQDAITFGALELLNSSTNEQNMDKPLNSDSLKTDNRKGLMAMANSIGPGIQQQGSQMAMAQQSGGLPSQPTSNMAQQFASGGIIGFSKGGMKKDRVKTKAYRPQPAIPVGNSNQPIPMLMQKYGSEKVTQFIAEQRALDAKARALAEAGSAAGSMQIEDHKLMKEIFSEKYRDILNESMGMAGGGIVGFQDGGRIKRFQGLEGSEVKESGGLNPLSFANWALSKSIDLTVLGAQEIAALAAEFSNTEAGQNQRNILGEVASGAAKKIIDTLPISEDDPNASRFPEMDANIQRGRDKRRREAVPAVSKFQQELIDAGNANVNDQLLAADQRGGGIASNLSPSMFERVLPGLSGLYTDEMRAADEAAENMTLAEGMGQFREDVGGVMRRIGSAIPTDADIIGGLGSFADGLGVDLNEARREIFPRSTRYGDVATETGVQAPLLERVGASIRDVSGIPYRAYQEAAGIVKPGVEQLGTGMFGEIDDIGQEVAQTDAAVVADIVNNAPAAQTSASTTNRAQLLPSDQAEVTAANLVNAENGMPAIDSFDSEVTTTGAGTADSAGLGTFLADSVAGNISTASAGYQAKLDAAIARQDDPLQAISTFLRAMGEGDTIGEGMQLAGKALDSLRRSNDAEQIALLQLLETGRISEQDFQLKRLQIQNEKDQIIEYRENSKRVLQAAQGRVAASVSAALMGQYQDVFQDVADREAMSQTLLQQAENEAAREVGGVPRFGGIDKLNEDPAFTALVNTKLTVLMENAIAAQLQKASRYAGRP